MTRWTRAAVIAVLATGALSMAACDDDSSGPTNPPKASLLQVKPGAWTITPNVAGGGGACPTFRLTPFCTIYGEELDVEALLRSAQVDCEVTVAGTQISAACAGSITIGACSYRYNGSGNGSITGGRDSFVVSAPVTLSRTAGGSTCPTTCTYTVLVSGVWVGEACPEAFDEPAAFTVPPLYRDAYREAP